MEEAQIQIQDLEKKQKEKLEKNVIEIKKLKTNYDAETMQLKKEIVCRQDLLDKQSEVIDILENNLNCKGLGLKMQNEMIENNEAAIKRLTEIYDAETKQLAEKIVCRENNLNCKEEMIEKNDATIMKLTKIYDVETKQLTDKIVCQQKLLEQQTEVMKIHENNSKLKVKEMLENNDITIKKLTESYDEETKQLTEKIVFQQELLDKQTEVIKIHQNNLKN